MPDDIAADLSRLVVARERALRGDATWGEAEDRELVAVLERVQGNADREARVAQLRALLGAPTARN